MSKTKIKTMIAQKRQAHPEAPAPAVAPPAKKVAPPAPAAPAAPQVQPGVCVLQNVILLSQQNPFVSLRHRPGGSP